MIPTFEPTRLIRTFRQHIRAVPQDVFPLLCPDREKEWLPGWDARMLYSASGVAEPQAVFTTLGSDGSPVIWAIVEHRPPRRSRFVRWHPDEMVVELEIDVSSDATGLALVDVRYTYTAISDAGAQRIAQMTEAQWQEQMQRWESAMNAWFEHGPVR